MKSFIDFIKESVNSLNDIKEKYKEDVSKFRISERGDKILLDLVVVKTQNAGIGTKIMRDICSYADKQRKTIILTPSKDFGGSIPRLIKFYKEFSFVENKGKNKDYEISEAMYREPK